MQTLFLETLQQRFGPYKMPYCNDRESRHLERWQHQTNRSVTSMRWFQKKFQLSCKIIDYAMLGEIERRPRGECLGVSVAVSASGCEDMLDQVPHHAAGLG